MWSSLKKFAIVVVAAALPAAAQRTASPGSAVEVAPVLQIARKAPPLPNPEGAVIRVSDVPSLRQAVAEAAPGTTIMLADGVYRLDELLVTGRNLTLRGESGDRDKVVLDGEGKFTKIVRVRGAKNLTIADLTVANSRQYGIFFLGDSDIDHLKVYNVKFHNCYVRGLKGTGATRVDDSATQRLSVEEAEKIRPRNGEVRYCLFINDDVTPNGDIYSGDYVSGMDAMWLKDWVIADDTFINIRGQHGGGRGAIFIWINSEGVTAERNLVVGCDRGICFGNPSGEPLHMTRGIIRNNFIVAGKGQGIEICRTLDTVVEHNTIFCAGPDQVAVEFHQITEAGNRFRDNLYSGQAVAPSSVTAEGNVSGALAGWFRNPGAGDLRLTRQAAAGQAGARELPVR
jgi:nitrous oxidase accessory protein NosD